MEEGWQQYAAQTWGEHYIRLVGQGASAQYIALLREMHYDTVYDLFDMTYNDDELDEGFIEWDDEELSLNPNSGTIHTAG